MPKETLASVYFPFCLFKKAAMSQLQQRIFSNIIFENCVGQWWTTVCTTFYLTFEISAVFPLGGATLIFEVELLSIERRSDLQ